VSRVGWTPVSATVLMCGQPTLGSTREAMSIDGEAGRILVPLPIMGAKLIGPVVAVSGNQQQLVSTRTLETEPKEDRWTQVVQ
jgi:hypothetical protein